MTPLEALNHWAPIAWLRTDPLVYPILEVIHIVALAIVFGSLWIVDLRLLGWMRKLDVKELTSAVLPWTLGAFSFAESDGPLYSMKTNSFPRQARMSKKPPIRPSRWSLIRS